MGYACGIQAINHKFCYGGCIPFPNPAKSPISVNFFFPIAVALIWPLGVIMLFITCGGREFIVSKLISGTCEIPTFGLSWALIIFSFIYSFYIIIHDGLVALTFLLSESKCYRHGSNGFLPKGGIGAISSFLFGLAFCLILCLTTNTPNKALPVPKSIFVFINFVTFKYFRIETIKKVTAKLGTWILMLAFIEFTGYHLPIILMAILANPYRNTFLIISIISFSISFLALLVAVISIDQVFVSDDRVSVTGKYGCRQCLSWLYISILCLCGATFIASIHCLLLMDMSLPVRYNIRFSWIFSTVTTIAIPYIVVNLRNATFSFFSSYFPKNNSG